jgi:magnesium transporter
MINKYKHKKLTWINLEQPNQKETEEVMKEYSIPPLVADELLRPTLRPKVDVYPNLIYLILHFPVFDQGRQGSEGREIDFIIGKNFLITTHYETIDPLHEFSKIFEVNSVLDRSDIGEHAGFLVFYILRQLYDFSLRQLDHINEKIEKIEDNIFKGKEKQMVEVISLVNRDLLNFRQAIKPHYEILTSFEKAGMQFFGSKFSYHLSDMIGQYFKVANQLEMHKETMADLRETNDSLLSTKTNEIMKILTIMAFVTFPLSVIAGLFGMNTLTMPIIGLPGDFWIITGGMVLAMAGMFFFFKKKNWI